jgi:hypothetical protein
MRLRACSGPHGSNGPPARYRDVRSASAERFRAVTANARRLSRTIAVAPGRHAFRVRTLLRGTKLRPDRYRVQVSAVRADGARTGDRAYFWVLAPKRR